MWELVAEIRDIFEILPCYCVLSSKYAVDNLIAPPVLHLYIPPALGRHHRPDRHKDEDEKEDEPKDDKQSDHTCFYHTLPSSQDFLVNKRIAQNGTRGENYNGRDLILFLRNLPQGPEAPPVQAFSGAATLCPTNIRRRSTVRHRTLHHAMLST